MINSTEIRPHFNDLLLFIDSEIMGRKIGNVKANNSMDVVDLNKCLLLFILLNARTLYLLCINLY